MIPRTGPKRRDTTASDATRITDRRRGSEPSTDGEPRGAVSGRGQAPAEGACRLGRWERLSSDRTTTRAWTGCPRTCSPTSAKPSATTVEKRNQTPTRRTERRVSASQARGDLVSLEPDASRGSRSHDSCEDDSSRPV